MSLLKKGIPSPVDWIEPGRFGLLGVELRPLLQIALALILMQLVGYGIYFLLGWRETVNYKRLPDLYACVMLLGGALPLMGAMFLSNDLDQGTAAGLWRLPVTRGYLLRQKLAAQITAWILFVVLSLTLFVAMSALWGPLNALLNWSSVRGLRLAGDPPNWAWAVGFLLLGHALCVWFSLRHDNAVIVFVWGMLVALVWGGLAALSGMRMLFGTAAQLMEGHAGALFHAVSFAVPVVIVWALVWRRFKNMEEPLSAPEPQQWMRWSTHIRGVSLTAITWRQNWLFWLFLFVIPIPLGFALVALADLVGWDRAQWTLKAFWADIADGMLFYPPIVGVLAGAVFWTRPELDGTGFFAHHLPISRHRLFTNRFVVLAGFNAACALQALAVWSLNESPPPAISRIVVLLLQLLAVLTGALFAPMRPQPLITRFIIGLFAALIATPLVILSQANGLGGLRSLAFVTVFMLAAAWWVNVKSRGFEPGIRRQGRIWLLGFLCLLVSILVAILDLRSLLYLIGFDTWALG